MSIEQKRKSIVKNINSWTKAMNYQPIPLPGYEEIIPHRKDHIEVINKIFLELKNYNFKEKTLIDVGSNLGFFGLSFLKKNIKEIYLVEKIGKISGAVKEIINLENLKNVFVIESSINSIENAQKLPKCDIVIYKSIHHWIRKFSNNNIAKDIFKEITKNASIVIYEPGNFGNDKVSEEDDKLPELFGFKTKIISNSFKNRNIKICLK